MALPASDPNQVWPPQNLSNIFAYMRQWSAWYANDLAKLQAAYGGGVAADNTGFFASDTGGFKPTIGQRFQRWFVGQRPMGPNRNTKLPVPIAGMICQAMGDLLYSDPPTFTVVVDTDGDGIKGEAPNTPASNATQERLNYLADQGFYSTLAQATELAAALSGSFLRVAWDKSVVPDRPFLDVVDVDQAIPEFRWGRLVAVTFWEVVAKEGQTVWRHLERHETSPITGNGIILHGLYEGTDDKLGSRVSLTSRPETAALDALQALGAPGTVDSLSPGLCVEYLPNQGPNRLWRDHPIGRHLGRSTLDGVEHLMDQLAETLSDWMRARRAAKARTFLDKDLLGNPGPGNGMVADLDQEFYVQTDGLTHGPNDKMADKIQTVQPSFDPTGYEKTAATLIEQILQLSGFALQTFGMDQNSSKSADTTATEIESRERRTFLTRGRLIKTQTPHLARIVRKLLAVDRDVFNQPNVDAMIRVEFPDGVQESTLKLAQTVLALFQGENASRLERQKILHPDWNDDQWAAEVERIEAEFAQPISNPDDLPPEKPGSTIPSPDATQG
jgi:hypothetical protein